MTSEERFWTHVTFGEGCWEWNAYKTPHGYGRFAVNRNPVLAHRYSWELKHGAIANGLCVLHSCDNPACVRPEHLFVGTQVDNLRDCRIKNRARSFGGRKYAGEQHPRAKLSELDVINIRSSAESSMALSHRYGVTVGHIRRLIRGEEWIGTKDRDWISPRTEITVRTLDSS